MDPEIRKIYEIQEKNRKERKEKIVKRGETEGLPHKNEVTFHCECGDTVEFDLVSTNSLKRAGPSKCICGKTAYEVYYNSHGFLMDVYLYPTLYTSFGVVMDGINKKEKKRKQK